MPQVRTRFAPSPTGYLHIGGVRTALFCWLFAKANGGQFILRIDDTDEARNIEAALAPILHGFRWLGIDWDEGPEVGGPHAPYFQSQRKDRYRECVAQLLDCGAAYRDYARPEEIQAEREAAQKEKRPFLYSRQWMAESLQDAAAWEADGREGVVRMKMPREGKCEFTDLVRGDVAFDWAKEQDTVIQRADGSFIYHLASVVDDHDFEISHVIRAEEHLSNTPRQIFIAQSLGFDLPQYAHLPYVAEPGSKSKLSKRKLDKYLKNGDFAKVMQHGEAIARRIHVPITPETFNPVIVDFYEQVGYLPQAIVNYLMLLGWSLDDKTEFFNREQMLESFTLERVTKAPASFDAKKLWAFQDHYMGEFPLKQKIPPMIGYLQKARLISDPPPCDVGPTLTRIVEAAGDRIKVMGDVLDYADTFYQPDDAFDYDEQAFAKRVEKQGAADLLAEFRERLAAIDDWNVQTLEAALQRFIEEKQIKIGEIIHSIRVATTGKGVGIGLYDCLDILGKESTLARIDRSLAKAASA